MNEFLLSWINWWFYMFLCWISQKSINSPTFPILISISECWLMKGEYDRIMCVVIELLELWLYQMLWMLDVFIEYHIWCLKYQEIDLLIYFMNTFRVKWLWLLSCCMMLQIYFHLHSHVLIWYSFNDFLTI